MASIAELAPHIAARDVSSVELVTAALERITSRPDLNAFIAVLADSALADARRADEEARNGRIRGPLHGVPVSVKDLVDVAGVPTTSGSAVPPRQPDRDAPIVSRLRRAGAVIVGKTNLHEFALGTTGEDSAFGPTRNPYDPTRSAGGSSSGAAAALVEEMCWAAIGTDTGGSIRIPSAACGVVGLKPGFGELPTEGIVPLSTSCDHVGPMARSVDDVWIMFEALGGTAHRDGEREDRLTLGIPRGYLTERIDGEVRAAYDRVQRTLAGAGHRLIDVKLASASATPDVYLHIVLPEAAAYHAPMLERHGDRYCPAVRNRLEAGRYLLAEDYVRAMSMRERLSAEVDAALTRCDALLVPTLPITAPVLGQQTIVIEGREETVRAAMLRLTQLFNLTGHPAISLPAGRSTAGLPIGMQLVGASGGTARLLATARQLEPQITAGPGSVGGGTG